MSTNQVAVWGITFSADKNEKESIERFARREFKKWTFQKERGEGGYIHFQFKGSLKDKKRKCELLVMMRSGGLIIAEDSVSPTPKVNMDNYSYVDKDETRIEGPWSSDDKVDYIPTDMRETPKWRPMQQDIIDIIATKPNRRTIHCIIDSTGNNGKSFLAMWLYCHGISYYIPFFTEAKELMRMSHAMVTSGWRNTFFIDLPRALSHKAEHEIYGGIEQLKTGMIYEDRYDFKMIAIEACHVFIFTNRKPDMRLCSADRWNMLYLTNGVLSSTPS